MQIIRRAGPMKCYIFGYRLQKVTTNPYRSYLGSSELNTTQQGAAQWPAQWPDI